MVIKATKSELEKNWGATFQKIHGDSGILVRLPTWSYRGVKEKIFVNLVNGNEISVAVSGRWGSYSNQFGFPLRGYGVVKIAKKVHDSPQLSSLHETQENLRVAAIVVARNMLKE